MHRSALQHAPEPSVAIGAAHACNAVFISGTGERFVARTIAAGAGEQLPLKKVLDCIGMSVDQWGGGRFEAVACFPAAELRKIGLKVGWDPNTNDRAHCNA